MGILSGNPKHEPMHYGEIFHVWSFAMAAKNCVSRNQAYLNHAGDQDLKEIIRDILGQAKREIEECDALILENGLAPAPMLPERAEAKLEDIPTGARFTDPEIAAHLAADNALGLTACSTIMGMCIREDVAARFAKYHAAKAAVGLRLLRMLKDKAWLVPPPLHVQPELVEA